MAMTDRGFASMDRETVRAIASKGGSAVQASGHGRRWTVEEARAAGRKGAQIRLANIRLRQRAEQEGR